ncbi:MAG TPA: hypothetical protein VLE21_02615, partial [Candidatus Nitrosocosmicus sp.]|nr:hypothetical protein [Candidatus Nitrosocosmicus sp.]
SSGNKNKDDKNKIMESSTTTKPSPSTSTASTTTTKPSPSTSTASTTTTKPSPSTSTASTTTTKPSATTTTTNVITSASNNTTKKQADADHKNPDHIQKSNVSDFEPKYNHLVEEPLSVPKTTSTYFCFDCGAIMTTLEDKEQHLIIESERKNSAELTTEE